MEDNIILSAETQEAAEPVDVTDTGVDTVSVEENTSAETQEVAEPAAEDRSKADAAFADMRRRLQDSENEREIANAHLNRMKGILDRFGFGGETIVDSLDVAEANLTGQDVNSIRRERLTREKAQQEQNALQRELDRYRKADIERHMAEDLKNIQKIDPSVKNLLDLPPEYFSLIKAGLDGETAFLAIKAKADRNKKEAPPVIGRVNSKTTEERDYFTDKELNTLSGKDLDDPAVLAKAMKSMTRKK